MAEIFLSSVYNSLRHSKHEIIYLTPAICVNIIRKFVYLFIYYLFISPSHDFQHKLRMNERTNERTDGRTSGRASERGREAGNEWMNEWASERTNEQVREGGRERERVSDWFRECVNEFFGGYKVDFSKFKRCSAFIYCTAIQTKKGGQNMFWLESV